MRHKQRNSNEQGYESTAHHLLNKWGDINLHETQTKKLLYIKQGNWDEKALYTFLLNKEADTSPCNENKETPLHKACKRGHESIVNFLFDQEADINFLTVRNKIHYI